MTRKAYDSVTVSALPAGGDLYLGYVDGRYANVDEIKARFPHRHIVRITVTGRTFDADMADVENGDLSPASGAAWAKGKLQRGQFPVLYFPESSRAAVVAALKAAGVDPAKVGKFAAQYDGVARLNARGDIGKQYRSPDGTGAGKVTDGNYDVSVVADFWPGIDPRRPQGLALVTQAALRLVTRRMNARTHPVTTVARQSLTACRAAIDHALNVK